MKVKLLLLIVLATALIVISIELNHHQEKQPTKKYQAIALTKPIESQFTSLLKTRRSIRSFSKKPINKQIISTLLWSGQGISHKKGFRTTPSAGALYPLVLYVYIKSASGIPSGLYRYDPKTHSIIKMNKKINLSKLISASYKQTWMSQAPIMMIISGKYGKTRKKYGSRAKLYVHVEVGMVGQNIYLQATQLGLGTTIVGGFKEQAVKRALGISEIPFALMPIGYPSMSSSSKAKK